MRDMKNEQVFRWLYHNREKMFVREEGLREGEAKGREESIFV